MKVNKFVMTCGACPSQWEGHLEDGRMFYIRYRWGYLSARVSPVPTEDVYEAVSGEEVYCEELGGEYDGELSTEDMQRRTNMTFEW